MNPATVALLLAVTNGPLGQVEAPGQRDRGIDKPSVLSFSACGRIFEGKDFCSYLFQSGSTVYRLDNYGDFVPGETVTVSGVLDTGCDPGCVEPDACIRENTITADCIPSRLVPSTWGLVKALYL